MKLNIPVELTKKIESRIQDDSLRGLECIDLIDFTSNDFLGLASDPDLLQRIKSNINLLNNLGSGGSRLLSGNNPIIEEVESFLGNLFCSESALLFNSGYSANLALLSSIAGRNDLIFLDEKCHASIKDGARLSLAKKLSFSHSDSADLDRKLSLADSKGHDCFVVVEALYSMDGDFTPLKEIVKICNKHGAYLIVDEAHSTGVYGGDSCSWVVEQGLQDQVFARIHTFGKAIGISGACVVGSEVLKTYLINFARPFIYTTAPSFLIVSAIKTSFEYLQVRTFLSRNLFERIAYFKSKVATSSNSAIQPILVSGNSEAKKLALLLRENGLDVRAILSPTVPKGAERLRVCLHSFNTESQIDLLADLIKKNSTEDAENAI